MLPKIALRNIRRSIRDYTIYFVTLTIGVAIFYAFNSIESQQVMFDLQNAAEKQQFEQTQDMLNLFSGLIAATLGFLVLYANRFLIRRRKKEFGTYLLLGMSGASVSGIVLIETVVVGIGALALGSLLGVVLSQLLSILTATLFGTTIVNYTFVFSFEAFLSTIQCFAIIFVVVALFNTFSVNRYKLIDLLSADKKNERESVRNPWLCFAVFIVAIGVLMYAYLQLIESGMVMLDDPRFSRATVAMLVGSFLFFWSLAGFAIAIVTRLRGVYLKGLAMFTVRQIASKINTAFVSLWAVCVMLFFSITTFSCGMGLVDVFTGSVEEANPYDDSLGAQVWYSDVRQMIRPDSANYAERAEQMKAEAPERYAQGEAFGWDIAACLEANAPELWEQTVKDCAQIDQYEVIGVKYQNLIDGILAVDPTFEMGETLGSVAESNLLVVPVSDLNGVRTLQGLAPVSLEDDECMVMNNMEMSQFFADAIAKSGQTIDVLGHPLTFSSEIDDTQIANNAMPATAAVVAVPDYVIDEMKGLGALPNMSYLNVDFIEPGEVSTDNMSQIIAVTQPLDMDGFEKGYAGRYDIYTSLLWPVTNQYSKVTMVAQSSGMRLMITYLALYIGFVFLMATATIIAIQQLSEATDSIPRYNLLNKLGCDRRMINGSLFKQILIYFLAPLVLAICHSVCAISVLSESLYKAMGVPMLQPILMAGLLVLAIYGGYMAITYFVSRSIVNAK